MRLLLAVIGLALSASAAGLETARALADSRAPHLALARVESLQSGDPAAPLWGEWEALRLRVLVDLQRHDEALKRAAALPAAMPRPALRQCLLAAMRAATAAGQPAAARAHGARLLWQLEPTTDDARSARLLVIESYLAERRGDAAFRAMLRFDQDYKPIERSVAERFVEQLLEAGLHAEAVNWLAALDDFGPLKLRLLLHAGLVEPGEAIARAGAQTATGGAPWWRVLADAAERNGDATLRVEALERLLESEGGGPGGPPAAGLWRAYDREAQAAANEHRLLNGDDAAWLELAVGRVAMRPPRARAMLAWLSRNGATLDTRLRARRDLERSLQRDGLERAALRLFGDERVESPDAREKDGSRGRAEPRAGALP